jgi:hypothetical protein
MREARGKLFGDAFGQLSVTEKEHHEVDHGSVAPSAGEASRARNRVLHLDDAIRSPLRKADELAMFREAGERVRIMESLSEDPDAARREPF